MKLVNYVCRECGSDDVSWDAQCRWDVVKQELYLSADYDQAYCDHCGGECGTMEMALTEFEINAREKAAQE